MIKSKHQQLVDIRNEFASVLLKCGCQVKELDSMNFGFLSNWLFPMTYAGVSFSGGPFDEPKNNRIAVNERGAYIRFYRNEGEWEMRFSHSEEAMKYLMLFLGTDK